MASKSFASPFGSGVPGSTSGSLAAKLEAVKLPSAPAASGPVARLAAAIARLPSSGSGRGNASNLFLP